MSFEEEARVLLGKRNSSKKIEEFINLCSKIKNYELIDDFYYQSETSDEVKTHRKALNLIKKLLILQVTKNTHYVKHESLVDGFSNAFQFIQLNESLKTGGSPSDLSIGDMFRLRILKMYFEIVFPGYSGKFTQGNTLHKLGEALTGKKLSRTIDRHIDKMNENLEKLHD